MVDALLDPVTGDLVVQGGDVVLVSGAAEVTQAVVTALKSFKAEWALDPTFGVLGFNGDPFGKNPSLNAVRAQLLAAIAAVDGVDKAPAPQITSLVFDSATRKLTVTWTASASGEDIEGGT